MCVLWLELSLLAMADSWWPLRLYPARLLCLWNFPGKNTGVSFRSLLQGVFLIQELNLHLLHWRVESLALDTWEAHFMNLFFFFIHCSVNGHVGCFNVLTIINSDATHIGVYVSL